ncbi:MAG: substrate-binding domain-containing protein [Sulfurimonas sp.]
MDILKKIVFVFLILGATNHISAEIITLFGASDLRFALDEAKEPWVKKIAIANPAHTPYGENISQTAQFIESGAADIGVIALSLALAPTISKGDNPDYYLIDNKLHKPLLQGYSITKYAKDSLLAREFYDFMGSSGAKEILKKYGFEVK